MSNINDLSPEEFAKVRAAAAALGVNIDRQESIPVVEMDAKPEEPPYEEPLRRTFTLKGAFNVERLAEELEATAPQAVEGIEWGNGEVTITLKPGQEGWEMPLRAVTMEHDPAKPSKTEKELETRKESALKLQEVDFDTLKAGVDEIKSNPVLHTALMGLLTLNYRLASAAGFVTEKPEWVDD